MSDETFSPWRSDEENQVLGTCTGSEAIITPRLVLPGNLPTHTAYCCVWTRCGCSSPAGWPARLSEQHPSQLCALTLLPDEQRHVAQIKTAEKCLTKFKVNAVAAQRTWSCRSGSEKSASGLEALRNVFFRLAAFAYSSHKHEPFMQVRHTKAHWGVAYLEYLSD